MPEVSVEKVDCEFKDKCKDYPSYKCITCKNNLSLPQSYYERIKEA